MKPSRLILPALLLMALVCCWLAVISLRPSRVHVANAPAVSYASVTVPGILTNPDFQTVRQALVQRSGVNELSEPEVTTIHYGAINHAPYVITLAQPVTNK